MIYDWAGVPFLSLYHRDGRMIRGPGLWGFVRREPSGDCTLLFIDHAEAINEAAAPGRPRWTDALILGMNEVHVCLKAKARIDRLQLRSHIIRRVGPLLNVLDEAHPVSGAALDEGASAVGRRA